MRLLLIGPLPPPSGGMANQTRQLGRLLQAEGVAVHIVQTNAPYRPAWIERLRGLRALFRLLPYLWQVYRAAGDADVVHVMANSGWAWHLMAAPALWLARLRGVPVVINYRGGLAEAFLDSHGALVRPSLARAAALVVPTGFLREIFRAHGLEAQVIPNVVDITKFAPAERAVAPTETGPHIVVTRNLEHLYGNDVALRAFVEIQRHLPQARLTIAGSGPERAALEALASQLGVNSAVRFTGRLELDDMVALYRSADIALNPTRADNSPNSVLEALACGVPVVSTDVGGVPFLVRHEVTAWLVPPESPEQIAAGVIRVVEDGALRERLVSNGLELARACAWLVVRHQWLELYAGLGTARSAHAVSQRD